MLCITPLQLRFYLPASSTRSPLFPSDQIPRRWDAAPSSSSLLRSHLCPGAEAMLSGDAHSRAISLSFCPLFGKGGDRDLRTSCLFYHFCNKKARPFPGGAAGTFCKCSPLTQSDSQLLPHRKGLSPLTHTALPELRC